MFSSSKISFDIGFLGMPLQERLFPSMVVHVYNPRRRQGLIPAIQRTVGAFLKSMWK